MKYTTIEIDIEYDVYLLLKELAKNKHQSISTVVSRLLAKYIKQLRKEELK
jgi:hypothetical protein